MKGSYGRFRGLNLTLPARPRSVRKMFLKKEALVNGTEEAAAIRRWQGDTAAMQARTPAPLEAAGRRFSAGAVQPFGLPF